MAGEFQEFERMVNTGVTLSRELDFYAKELAAASPAFADGNVKKVKHAIEAGRTRLAYIAKQCSRILEGKEAADDDQAAAAADFPA